MKPSSPPDPSPSEPPLPATVEACHAVIASLLERLARLEEQLKVNSRNSSKPPSGDGPGALPRKTRKKSGRSLGGQAGHKGSFRALLAPDEVDRQVRCVPPELCPDCGAAVVRDEGKPIRHQVFEVPALTAEVTEYVRERGICTGCGHRHHATLPSGVPRGQLGPRALALVGTLAGQFHLSQAKVRDLLGQVMGVRFSLGAISEAHGHVAQALATPVRELHTEIARAPVRHADETSHQSHTSRMWLWAQVTPWGAAFRIDPSRGKLAAQALLGKAPQGVIVSDRYAGYAWIDASRRQVCWSHLLRDFARIGLRQGLPGRIGRRLEAYGFTLFRWRTVGAPAAHYGWLQKRIRTQLQAAADQSACSRTAKTCRNLLALWPALWHFLDDPAVPPTNNAAERALRGFVIRRKLSYFTRSGRGLRFIEHTFSTVQTCRLQGRNVFDYMTQALSAWLAGTSPPSLVPEPIRTQHAAA